jgi:hypothetical protein
VTLGGYLNEMSLLVLAAHALTVWLARCGRPTSSAGRPRPRWGRRWSPLVLVSLVQHDAIGWIPGRA